MTAANFAQTAVTQYFDRAAESYDQAASVQAQVARHLVEKAVRKIRIPPQTILDIGGGTGLVAEMAARHWPDAQMTVTDGAPAMLEQARRKLPKARVVARDMADPDFEPAFDLILSSMALHWMPDPRTVFSRWRNALKPQGCLFAALLVEGSFREWRDLCATEGLIDGLWSLPRADFAGGPEAETGQQSITVDYPTALDFLYRLKATGAAMPRPGHRPFDTASMRRLLSHAPQPFAITYRVLYLYMNAPSPDSI